MKGTILKSTGSRYIVLSEKGERVDCRVRGKLRLEGIKATNPVSAGDHVLFEMDGPGSGSICELLPRKNYIIRKATNLSKQAHIIAANIDQAFVVVTLAFPRTSTGFIDRFLATAEAYDVPANIVFNKMDIYTEEGLDEVENVTAIYSKIGYRCFKVSAIEGTGTDELIDAMKGKVNLFSGHSGVGKSTLINSIQPGLDLTVGDISEAHGKGTHTTTFAEMHPLSFGGFIIDTPGIKEFGMVNMERTEISHYFPEIFERSKECKFNTCLHVNEPKCAVIAAVESGEIAA
ncbi:MAG TPA: ribosome small subunit-dependent GTPase A, partial [Bacteroidia bacterium]